MKKKKCKKKHKDVFSLFLLSYRNVVKLTISFHRFEITDKEQHMTKDEKQKKRHIYKKLNEVIQMEALLFAF